MKLIALLRPTITLLLAWWLIIFSFFRLPTVLRFENPMLNYGGFILLALAMPASLFWLASKRSKLHVLHGLIYILATISVFPASVAVFSTLLDMRNLVLHGVDHSYEKISELQIDNSYYRLYRINGGATTAYDLSLSEEKPLGIGLKLVRSINGFNAHRAGTGKLQRLSQHKMRLTFQIGGDEKEHMHDFDL